MNLTKMAPDQLLQELDALRNSKHLSYQNLADACNVSQATIYRAFKRQTEPTLELLQKIAAAVGYEPQREPLLLQGYTQDAYVEYLQKSLQAEKEEHRLREARSEARHNMILNQKTRTIVFLSMALTLLAVGFISWLIIDVTHPTVGWFQREIAYHSGTSASIFPNLLSFWEEIKNICSNII